MQSQVIILKQASDLLFLSGRFFCWFKSVLPDVEVAVHSLPANALLGDLGAGRAALGLAREQYEGVVPEREGTVDGILRNRQIYLLNLYARLFIQY